MTQLDLSQFADTGLFRAALATSVLLSFGIYGALNKPGRKYDVLMTRWDHKMPFLPAFSIPYLLYLPFLLFVVIYGILDTPFYPQIALSVLAVQLVAAFIYYRQQTHVPRPAVSGQGVFSRLTALIYKFDQPYCTFPSLHVAYSVVCGYWSAAFFPYLTTTFALLAVAIIASTIFLKQHAFADVLAGLTVATLSLILSGGHNLA